MTEAQDYLSPDKIRKNPENPRLVFRQEDLDALEDSIKHQGILVPLTVYRDGDHYTLLDGERRWRCARKLGMKQVPVIVQPKPDRLTNIMMMFAIHNARKDWDPLPTAMKLRDLEREFRKHNGRTPKEKELAELASLDVGVVRRLKKLLSLPQKYRTLLMHELEKPRTEQRIRPDHVLEASRGAESLRKREVITPEVEDELRDAIIEKFRTGTIRSTVDPRKLVRLSRAVQRGQVPATAARKVVSRIVSDPKYSIDDAYSTTIEAAEFSHSTEKLAARMRNRVEELKRRRYDVSDHLATSLRELAASIDRLLKGR